MWGGDNYDMIEGCQNWGGQRWRLKLRGGSESGGVREVRMGWQKGRCKIIGGGMGGSEL